MIPGVLLVLAAGLVTGALIGVVGVGGVLIAPLLVLLAGFDVHQAVAVASFSFIFTGVVAGLVVEVAASPLLLSGMALGVG